MCLKRVHSIPTLGTTKTLQPATVQTGLWVVTAACLWGLSGVHQLCHTPRQMSQQLLPG